MAIFLINPSDHSFGTAVITPRWLYVLAAATPRSYGDPVIVDETLEALVPSAIQAGDFVGIGIQLWGFVELYCLRGTVGQNRFGPDPLGTPVEQVFD